MNLSRFNSFHTDIRYSVVDCDNHACITEEIFFPDSLSNFFIIFFLHITYLQWLISHTQMIPEMQS